jgi:hypothetical protein
MKTRVLTVAVLASLLLGSTPLRAHHAFKAEFDTNKPVLLKGKVNKLEWINPHLSVHLEVKEPNGTVTSWLVECASPNGMLRTGLTKAALDVGSDLTIQGFQSKERARTAGATNIRLKNNQDLAIPMQQGGDLRTTVKTLTGGD